MIKLSVSRPLSIDWFTSPSSETVQFLRVSYITYVTTPRSCLRRIGAKNAFYTAIIIACGCVTISGIPFCLCSNSFTHGHYTVLSVFPPSRSAILIQCFEWTLNYNFDSLSWQCRFYFEFGKSVSPFILISLPFLAWKNVLTRVYA